MTHTSTAAATEKLSMDSPQFRSVLGYFYRGQDANARFFLLITSYDEAVRACMRDLNLSGNDEPLVKFTMTAILGATRTFEQIMLGYQLDSQTRVDAAVSSMRRVFAATLWMLRIMFGFGVCLAIVGLSYGVVSGNVTSLIIGGVGVLDLAFFLLRDPIARTNESVANLMQLRGAYSAYVAQLQQWKEHFDWQRDQPSISTKRDAAAAMHTFTESTLSLIQQYCKPTLDNQTNGRSTADNAH